MTPELKNRIMLARDGSDSALDELVRENTPLVKSIAKRFIDRGAEFEDLVQIGTIGLIRAIRGFNFEFETALSTYAVPMITGEIKRFLRDDGIIKVGRETKSCAMRIRRFSADFETREGRSPTVGEVTSALEISEEEMVFALNATLSVGGLETKGEDGEWFETLPGVDSIEESFDKIAVAAALERLSSKERQLIALRYFRGLTQEETARILGLTQVKVSRNEKKICAKLKSFLE